MDTVYQDQNDLFFKVQASVHKFIWRCVCVCV